LGERFRPFTRDRTLFVKILHTYRHLPDIDMHHYAQLAKQK